MDRAKRMFTIATPRTKGAVGFLGEAGAIDLDGMTVECKTPFAGVMATSLDGKPLDESRRMLLTVVARAENTGQAFAKNHTTVPERGRLPVLAEPVDSTLCIRAAGPATIYPLDETGKRRAAVSPPFAGGVLRIATRELRSPWCEIVLE
jgi:hypothetical protein